MTYSAKQISNGNPIKTTIFGSLTHIKLRSLANGLAKYSLVEYPKLYHHILIMLSLFYEAIIIKPPTCTSRRVLRYICQIVYDLSLDIALSINRIEHYRRIMNHEHNT
uniref:Uncharacterized protein n=1 Tax=Leptocylindrus danicus TaxID=163516 RepID=A0A6U2PTL1_9STRA|mmetsp:Transcript_26801/g.39696  ORF Transcript_26801/g.39696 Transcript_26801/m.39696 type:complete len:108 (+) Transcript_26801:315-638(+)